MDFLTWVTPLLMVAFGVAVKRWPALAGLPNQLIWLFNLAIGVLAKLVGPEPAHAGFFGDMWNGLGWLWPPIQVVIARQIYETFIRPSEQIAGVEPVPVTTFRKKK